LAGILFIISAPSGSGKSTLVNRLRSFASDIEFSISYTTRAPRGSEQDGQEYHFTTRERFQQMVAAGEFLEWAEVFGNFYGTARHSLDDAQARGKDLFLDIDVQGAAQVREAKPESVSIFVLPPDPETLEIRLRSRSRTEGGLSEETIQRRLAQARNEIQQYRQYKYVLINDVLERAVEELAAIVAAERYRNAPEHADRFTEYAKSEASRALEVASGCLQSNAKERLRPVLFSFGLLNTAAVHV
jgi:guanylate kinase